MIVYIFFHDTFRIFSLHQGIQNVYVDHHRLFFHVDQQMVAYHQRNGHWQLLSLTQCFHDDPFDFLVVDETQIHIGIYQRKQNISFGSEDEDIVVVQPYHGQCYLKRDHLQILGICSSVYFDGVQQWDQILIQDHQVYQIGCCLCVFGLDWIILIGFYTTSLIPFYPVFLTHLLPEERRIQYRLFPSLPTKKPYPHQPVVSVQKQPRLLLQLGPTLSMSFAALMVPILMVVQQGTLSLPMLVYPLMMLSSNLIWSIVQHRVIHRDQKHQQQQIQASYDQECRMIDEQYQKQVQMVMDKMNQIFHHQDRFVFDQHHQFPIYLGIDQNQQVIWENQQVILLDQQAMDYVIRYYATVYRSQDLGMVYVGMHPPLCLFLQPHFYQKNMRLWYPNLPNQFSLEDKVYLCFCEYLMIFHDAKIIKQFYLHCSTIPQVHHRLTVQQDQASIWDMDQQCLSQSKLPYLDLPKSTIQTNMQEHDLLLDLLNQTWSDGLQFPIGIDQHQEMIFLNLQDMQDGPHGLIAGMTGSGKSEAIVTIMVMAALYHSCDQLQFVCLDYKGGSGINRLLYHDYPLPHLLHVFTNLQQSENLRVYYGLLHELEFRQHCFQQLEQEVQRPITHLDQYEQLRKEHPKLAHICIIVDEFAELKQQQPDFLNALMKISRIGRSLGIHLILATQKPMGVINDQIWSNANFKLCLKVASEQDSYEVLHHKLAAKLTKAGQFYLESSNQSQSGQCFYLSAPIHQNDHQILLCDEQNHILQQYQQNTCSKSYLDVYLEYIVTHQKQRKLRPLWQKPLEMVSYQWCIEQQSFGCIDDFYHCCYVPLTFKQTGLMVVLTHDHAYFMTIHDLAKALQIDLYQNQIPTMRKHSVILIDDLDVLLTHRQQLIELKKIHFIMIQITYPSQLPYWALLLTGIKAYYQMDGQQLLKEWMGNINVHVRNGILYQNHVCPFVIGNRKNYD